MSSMELSASSLLSSNDKSTTRKASQELPFNFENDEDLSPAEDSSSERAFKKSILHQYCKSYQSPSPSPKKDSLKQKLRFSGGGWEHAVSPAPLSPQHQRPNNSVANGTIQKPDRRKMMSRWASTGHLCPTDDESEKETRDKPPTSPVRRAPAARVTTTLPAMPRAPFGDSNNKSIKESTADDKSLASTPSRRAYFQRWASTGVMYAGNEDHVKIHNQNFCSAKDSSLTNAPLSPPKNDKAPICPDRRRRNSTGSTDSTSDDLLVCLTDDDEDMATFAEMKNKRKSSKQRKSRRASTTATTECPLSGSNKGDSEKNSSEGAKSGKKKSKKKEKPSSNSKDKKDKSSKKSKDKSSSKSSNTTSSPPDSPVKKSLDPRDCLQNESLFSLLGQSASTLLTQSTQVFQAPEADPKPLSRPLRTFSRRASTGVLKGEGMVTMTKAKVGGTANFAARAPFSPGKNVEKLRSIFEKKS